MRIITQPSNMDLNNDGKVTIDELARSTLLIYVQIVGAASAVLWGLWVLVAGQVPAVVTALRVEGAIVAFSVPVAAYIGIKRMLRYERMEDRERIAWTLEHDKALWEFNQARGVADDARAGTLSQADIDVAARQILSRYYGGKPWSRDEMVGAGLLTAELWNEANALLKKRGIRRGRNVSLEPDTFAAAWGLYCEAKQRANSHRVSNGNWTEAR